MNEPYIIGVDIGTGSIKTIAMNFNGKVLGSDRYYYQTVGESSELDVHFIFEAFRSSIRGMVEKMGSDPAAVSLSSMMHGIMAVAEDCHPLSNLILWSDTRSREISSRLRNTHSGNKIYINTGTPVHAMSPLCKVKWMKEREENIFHKAHKFISIKEFIWYQLFGEYVVDYSVASATGFFNIDKKLWDADALSFIPIEEKKLSRPVPTSYLNKNIKPSIAGELGIAHDTPFCIGGSDGCLANLGSLCLEPSVVAITIGTSAAVRLTRNKPLRDVESMPFNYILDDDHFICGGAINNGGNIIEWLVDRLISPAHGQDRFENVFKLIGSVPVGSDGLLFLPYLHGERAPVWDEQSSGVYFGVKSVHGSPHFARAAMEGVCFALADILFLMERLAGPVHEIKLSGGLARTGILTQMLADITGKNILVQTEEDSSAIGACYLGLKAIAAIDDFKELQGHKPDITKPKQANVKIYRDYFELYKKLYPALKEQMQQLYAITQH